MRNERILLKKNETSESLPCEQPNANTQHNALFDVAAYRVRFLTSRVFDSNSRSKKWNMFG